MPPIFRDVVMSWKGKEYRIMPNMRLLNKIEQNISLAVLAHKLSIGNPPLSHLAFVISEMLIFAGAKVTDEEVYQELMYGSQDAITEMAQAVILAVFPEAKASKKKTPSET